MPEYPLALFLLPRYLLRGGKAGGLQQKAREGEKTMTAEKKSKPISFALVTAGLAFFFNPQFAALDLLPDFIGCLLILSMIVLVTLPDKGD